MNDIKEFTTSASLYEILSHLMDKVIAGDLCTFEALKKYAAVLPKGQRTAAMLRRAFFLQRRLYWGFFKDVSPESYPQVWSQVVLPDRDYPFAGDLKRFMSIQNVYLCMIDIHGYTRYCHDNRHNMSMLDLLDRMLQIDVPRIATESGVISKRAHGDEILLLGSSATSVLEAVLRIVEYFSRRKRFEEGPAGKPGAGFTLPEFFISAGIAGGQTYTSLVITRDGDISGDLVNTAARLQARANNIAPDRNKILLTSHVYQKLKGAGVSIREVYGINKIDFFNTGTVEFKGVSLSVYDTVFLETEAYRLAYRDEMEDLYDALDKGMWKSRIFDVSMSIAAKIIDNLPRDAGNGVDSRGLAAAVKLASDSFAAENYEKAVSAFASLLERLSSIPGLDDLALEYLAAVQENYAAIVQTFVQNLDRDVDDHLDAMYGQKELENYRLFKLHHALYEDFLESSRLKVRGRKAIWYRVTDQVAPELGIHLQSRN